MRSPAPNSSTPRERALAIWHGWILSLCPRLAWRREHGSHCHPCPAKPEILIHGASSLVDYKVLPSRLHEARHRSFTAKAFLSLESVCPPWSPPPLSKVAAQSRCQAPLCRQSWQRASRIYSASGSTSSDVATIAGVSSFPFEWFKT